MSLYPPPAVRRELELSSVVEIGAKGLRARRVQEWLTFHGHATAIDAVFGSATRKTVQQFQAARGLPATGRVNQQTWAQLVLPLADAVNAGAPQNATFDAAVLEIARSHLRAHPIELGGDNLGPWVRAYCGEDGPAVRWCAGFVTFVLRQASHVTGGPLPIPGSLSCDSLAYQAKERNRFIAGTSIEAGKTSWGSLGSCQIFLVRHSPSDWTHTGFAFSGDGATFATIEGNTNDDGIANGFEVCTRVRSLPSKDLIALV